MRIVLLVEGVTEKVFIPKLREYLKGRLAGNKMPSLDTQPCDGLLPTGDHLKRDVLRHLTGKNKADVVIALTDVYVGEPRRFKDAADAKAKMRQWVGDVPGFYPHAAQYEFEAWLLPYWSTIQKLAEHNKAAPARNPENVNHDKPPSRRIKEIFEAGRCGRSYVKRRDATRILENADLSIAVDKCPELRALVNTILEISGGAIIP